MAGIWLYDEKSLFLERTGIALLFASLVYIGMNMIILFYPHIMYGLPLEFKLDSPTKGSTQLKNSISTSNDSLEDYTQNQLVKNELLLFTPQYIAVVESLLESSKVKRMYLNADFMLVQISKESGIPAHHLTYYFNDIKQVSFSEWRNSLRIKYAMELIDKGETNAFTLQSVAQQSGFSSQSTFIRAFKNVTGTTPSNYSKSNT
jgi:AraC-like DNA-binding protein